MQKPTFFVFSVFPAPDSPLHKEWESHDRFDKSLEKFFDSSQLSAAFLGTLLLLLCLLSYSRYSTLLLGYEGVQLIEREPG